MREKPSPEHSIERINNSKGYEPGNCKWATDSEQQRNTRRTRHISAAGIRKTLIEWANDLGCHPSVILTRIGRLGWSEERAVTTPINR